jgi:porin
MVFIPGYLRMQALFSIYPTVLQSVRRLSVVFSSCILLITCTVVSSLADDEAEKVSVKDSSPESIDKTLESRDQIAYDPTTRSLFPQAYVAFSEKLYEWERKLGLEIAFTYDFLTQGYADNDQSLGGTAGDAAVSGRWLMFGSKFNLPVYLNFRVRNRHAYSEHPPSDIASETGLIWKTVDGFNDSGLQIPDLYVSQNLRNDTIILRYGQMSIDSFFDSHRLRGAKRYFLNQIFSSNPTINFPSFGAGFVGYWKGSDNWDLVGGGSNIQGTEQGTNVDFNLNSTALFSSLQGGYRFQGFNGKALRAQLMGWHSDSSVDDGMPEGSGFSITLEHEGGVDDEVYVLRFGHANGGSTNTDTALFAGYGKRIRKFDNLGIGVGAGRYYLTGGWQGVFETYYRWQVTKELVITPDLQLITGEGTDDDQGFRFVAGLRMGIIF